MTRKNTSPSAATQRILALFSAPGSSKSVTLSRTLGTNPRVTPPAPSESLALSLGSVSSYLWNRHILCYYFVWRARPRRTPRSRHDLPPEVLRDYSQSALVLQFAPLLFYSQLNFGTKRGVRWWDCKIFVLPAITKQEGRSHRSNLP